MCEGMLVRLGFDPRQVAMGVRLQKALEQPVTCAAIATVIKKTPRNCTKQVTVSSNVVAFACTSATGPTVQMGLASRPIVSDGSQNG